MELFLHREGRAPAARETIRVDGDTVKIGAWLAKARTKHRAGQLPDEGSGSLSVPEPRRVTTTANMNGYG
ncbi:hypothetical protein [Streptomyces incanus]